jgi:hypothetical protein
MPTRLTSIMRLEEKKYIRNSKGFLREKEPTSVSIPNMRKKRENTAMNIFLPHQRLDPMEAFFFDICGKNICVILYCQASSLLW